MLKRYESTTYFEVGEGDKTFLLLHNAGGNHKMMLPICSYFAKRGRVIAPDLPGHGGSDLTDLSIEGIGKQIKYFCEKIDASNITVIGLNYGANIAVVLADIAEKLVLIEPPICMDEKITKEVEKHILDLERLEPVDYAKLVVDEILKSGPPEYRKIAVDAFVNTPAQVQQTIYRNLIAWNKKYQLKKEKVSLPTLIIQGKEPFAKREDLELHFSSVEFERLDSVGPWMTLEAPDKLSVIIDRFLA